MVSISGIYAVPNIIVLEYFPQRRGLVSGILLFCYNLGPSTYNILLSSIVNPNNEDAKKITVDGDDIEVFPLDVANRTPEGIRVLAYISFGLVILGSALIFRKPGQFQNSEKAKASIKQTIMNT